MKKLTVILFLFVFSIGFSQENFTKKDSLRGGLRLERNCFDVLHYDLNIKIDPEKKSIVGFNEITFKNIENATTIQLDLFANMAVDSIVFKGTRLNYKRVYDAVFVSFPTQLTVNLEQKIRFYYSGNPLIAKRAPWDGGFIFKKDSNNLDWIGVAVQGTGASLWYPCKDTQTDEPDFGITIKVAVPNGLMEVSNGKFIGSEDLKNGFTRWDWEVKNPINNYDITVNIGDYIHFGENYKGLDLDFFVLRENEAKARIQFEQVKPMLDCFQSKFGEYPFKEDGYKLVETSYLGMEHQSAVAYGNKFRMGYLGNDLSATGIGLLFDFIIVHESGHEWFGNSITSKDVADMWIHEGFTTYSEAVFVECQWGYEKGQTYLNGMKQLVRNDKPIVGKYDVNNEGSQDMYSKGALLLNTLRHVINNDTLWWQLLYKYTTTFKHKIIDTATVIAFFNAESKLQLGPIFNQYLHYASIPLLDLKWRKNELEYRWQTDELAFDMPVDIQIKGKKIRLYPTNKTKKIPLKIKNKSAIEVLQNDFYIRVLIN